MADWLFYLLLLLAILAAVFLAFFSPPALKRRALVARARADYRQARGAAHLEMLREAVARLEAECNRSEQALSVAQANLAALDRARAGELSLILERRLVETRLTEVPGIGAVLRDRILASGFRGRLTDLYHLSHVEGIGEARQQAIRAWAESCQAHLPALLQEDFPGKKAVEARHSPRLKEMHQEILAVSDRIRVLNDLLRRPRTEIELLSSVKAKDFARALVNGAPPSPQLEAYLRGAFAEWEPMPEWFRQILGPEPR